MLNRLYKVKKEVKIMKAYLKWILGSLIFIGIVGAFSNKKKSEKVIQPKKNNDFFFYL